MKSGIIINLIQKMKFFLVYILTLLVSFLGNYIGAALELSFPLSEANTLWILRYVLLFSLLIYIPALVVLLRLKRRQNIWLFAIELMGFFASAYFQFLLVGAIASI